jgi:hypothetical protein
MPIANAIKPKNSGPPPMEAGRCFFTKRNTINFVRRPKPRTARVENLRYNSYTLRPPRILLIKKSTRATISTTPMMPV